MNIYLHGNCQVGALASMMSEVCSTDIKIQYCEVFDAEIHNGDAEMLDIVSNADVIIAQPVSDGYRGVDFLATSWLKKNKKKNCQFIVFPVIFFKGQIPSSTTLKDCYLDHLAYHDMHAIDYFLQGKTAKKFVQDITSSDFFSSDFIRSESYRSISELISRELSSGCDVSVSLHLMNSVATSQPMYAVNHPSRKILVEVCNNLFGLMKIDKRVSLEGRDYLDHFVSTPYISTLHALSNIGTGIRLDEVKYNGKWCSIDQYFDMVFESYHTIGVDSMKMHVNNHPEISAYLKRFYRSQQGKNMPENIERKLIESLYDVFLGRFPNSNEVLAHMFNLQGRGMKGLVNTFPESEEFRSEHCKDLFSKRFFN